MNGGVLPLALLCVAVGLALAFATHRVRITCLAICILTAWCSSILLSGRVSGEGVFLGCWASIAACAVVVYRARVLSPCSALALSVNGGLWSGVLAALQGPGFASAGALLCVVVSIPGAWIVAHRRALILKVITSWVLAVALLAAVLQFLPVTPGYLPDHLQ